MPDPIAGLTTGSGASTKDPRRCPFCCLSCLVAVFSDLSVSLALVDGVCAVGFASPFGAEDSGRGALLGETGSWAAHRLVRDGLRLATTKEHKKTIARRCPTLLEITTRSWCTGRLGTCEQTVVGPPLRETAKTYRHKRAITKRGVNPKQPWRKCEITNPVLRLMFNVQEKPGDSAFVLHVHARLGGILFAGKRISLHGQSIVTLHRTASGRVDRLSQPRYSPILR